MTAPKPPPSNLPWTDLHVPGWGKVSILHNEGRCYALSPTDEHVDGDTLEEVEKKVRVPLEKDRRPPKRITHPRTETRA